MNFWTVLLFLSLTVCSIQAASFDQLEQFANFVKAHGKNNIVEVC